MYKVVNNPPQSSEAEKHFAFFRKNVIGINAEFNSPYGIQKVVYADWIASGRLYGPIEDKIRNQFGEMVGNTHSESTETGSCMTHAYHLAHQMIKQHVNASENDVIITAGSGMTSVLSKFMRILGVRLPERLKKYCAIPQSERPVVFITHMEHHSNHTPWLESLADVVLLPPDEDLLVCPESLRQEIVKYNDRKLKIGSFSACSNVTGIHTPYRELAEIMHEHGGYCFIDFAASAPYVDIDMHPSEANQHLDAIFFSPHKFLGGPGSPGVLIFNKKLYKNRIPDHPGGGTVTWTNPWGEHHYIDDIELREDGGTPGFLQTIKAALAIRLKEEMNVGKMHDREQLLVNMAFKGLRSIPGLHILADKIENRLGVFSFYVKGVHHNLLVKILNDRFGIQVRGGCSCAGTYGHYLLHVKKDISKKITDAIDRGDNSLKPGWIRLSLHPVMTEYELNYIISAINETVANIDKWKKDYVYHNELNEFFHCTFPKKKATDFKPWFQF